MARLRSEFLFVITFFLACCGKPKPANWEPPAGPEEKFSPGFPEQAAKLCAALEQARQKLATSETNFDQVQPELRQLRQETQKAIVTRVDRDLDFLLEGYAGKLGMLRNYRNLRNGDEYLPALRVQLDECQAELDKLFATRPMPHPIPPSGPVGPCLVPVPRAK
jgi:hypothetical protein